MSGDRQPKTVTLDLGGLSDNETEAAVAALSSRQRGRPSNDVDDPERLRPLIGYDSDGLGQVLALLDSALRHDLRTGEYELRRGSAGQWQPLDELNEAQLREDAIGVARADSRNVRDWDPPTTRWDRAKHAYLASHGYDPVSEWLDSLRSDEPPDIDPAELLIDLFGGSQDIEPDHAAALRWIARAMFAGVIRRTRQPGAKQDAVGVMVGPPHIGKSTLPKLLMPEPGWCIEALRLDVSSADGMADVAMTLRSGVLAIADELAGLRGDRVDAAKAILSGTQDNYRGKYERRSRTVARRVTIVGNCNPTKRLPFDPALERRLVLADLPARPTQPLEATLTPGRVADLWRAAVWHYGNTPGWASAEVPADVHAYSRRKYVGMLTATGNEMLAEATAEGSWVPPSAVEPF